MCRSSLRRGSKTSHHGLSAVLAHAPVTFHHRSTTSQGHSPSAFHPSYPLVPLDLNVAAPLSSRTNVLGLFAKHASIFTLTGLSLLLAVGWLRPQAHDRSSYTAWEGRQKKHSWGIRGRAGGKSRVSNSYVHVHFKKKGGMKGWISGFDFWSFPTKAVFQIRDFIQGWESLRTSWLGMGIFFGIPIFPHVSDGEGFFLSAYQRSKDASDRAKRGVKDFKHPSLEGIWIVFGGTRSKLGFGGRRKSTR